MRADQIRTDAYRSLDIVVEEARLAALDSYRALSAHAIDGLSRLSQETAASLAATQAAVSFVDQSRVWFGGAFGFSHRDAARENSFCDAVVRSGSPLLVPDGLADPRFWQHELVRGAPGVRCYAGVPLVDHGGYALGAVAVFSVAPAAFGASILQDLSALAVLVRDFLADARGTRPADQAEPAPSPARLVQGWLGVKTLTTDEGRTGSLAGLVVLSVAKGSPAHQAGLRASDLLHSIGGRELFVSSDVAAAMAGLVAGSRIQMRFRHLGQWQHSEIEVKSKRRRVA